MRLGGELRDVGERDLTKARGRELFLATVSDLVPDVLGSLRAEVLPAYKSTVAETRPPPVRQYRSVPPRVQIADWERWRWERGEWKFDEAAVPESVSRLRERALKWAKGWNLSDAWILDAVFRTLAVLVTHPSFEGFRPPHFFDLAERAPPFTFQHSGWQPHWKSRASFLGELREDFELAARKYMKAREEEATRRGFEPAPMKKAQLGANALQHFEWLVRFQVEGWTHERIKDEYGRSRSSVTTAIRETANLIGLTRRKQITRRPAKETNNP
jgi:hypothetical protein